MCGDPADPDVFAVGMIDGSVWMTEDGGQHFDQIVHGLEGWVRHMLIGD